jgi:hypothetical protein
MDLRASSVSLEPSYPRATWYAGTMPTTVSTSTSESAAIRCLRGMQVASPQAQAQESKGQADENDA